MPIQIRELPAGTVLTAPFKKQAHACTVEIDSEGKRTYVIGDKRFTSPSSAASSITGGAINGWTFWTPQGDDKPAKPAKRTRKVDQFNAEMAAATAVVAAKAARKPKTKASPLFKAMPPAADQTAGTARFWCVACQDSFDSEATKPEACAKGHRADDPELNAPPAPETAEAVA